MRTSVAMLAVVAAMMIPRTTAVARAQTLIAAEQPVVVRDVSTRGGVVSGVLVNRSGKLLRDVRLLFQHTWLWSDEMHPGEESPGRVDYYTVKNDLPPNGTVEFTYRPDPPLPHRDDGHFETSVDVVGWTEIG